MAQPFEAGSQDRNTNKYYQSSSRSAIKNGFAPARRGRPGTVVPVKPPMVFEANDVSSDKYYRENHRQSGQPALPVAQRRIAADTVKPLRVRTEQDLMAARDEVLRQLARGETHVRVQAIDGLDDRMRMLLELAASRAQITPEQLRDVRISVLPKNNAELVAEVFGPLNPTQVPLAVDTEPEMTEAEMRAVVFGEPEAVEIPAAETVVETPAVVVEDVVADEPVIESTVVEVPATEIVEATELDDLDED